MIATILDSAGIMVANLSWDTRNKNKFPTIYDKALFIKNRLQEIKKENQIELIFIEQSLQSFRSGFSSAKTLSTLSRFNGIISWLCFDLFDIEPTMVAAATARKTAGVTIKRGDNAKQKVLQFVVDNQPGFLVQYTRNGNFQPECFDRADSWVIAKSGFINCNQKE